MRQKNHFLVLLLMVMFVTVADAQKSATLEQLGLIEGQGYTVKTRARSSWVYDAPYNRIWSLDRTDSKENTDLDPADPDQSFGFVVVGENTYLYCIGADMFVNLKGNVAVTDVEPVNPIYLHPWNDGFVEPGEEYSYIMFSYQNGLGYNQFNDSGRGLRIDSWNVPDDGNMCVLTPTEFTFDPEVVKASIKQAYAVLSDDGETVTFYNDGRKAECNGAVEINRWYGESNAYRTATTAVFDASFANYRPTSTAFWFYDCINLTSISGMENLNTADVTNMYYMFGNCKNLTTIDLSNFNTENVTYMDYMFFGCSNLTTLDLSNFNTANVTDMGWLFWNCSSLTTLDVSKFNTANVTYMGYMFSGCSSLISLDVSNFNTANVTNMWDMFSGCSSLTTIDLSNFNTANVTTMNWMFLNCSSLTTIDLSNFNTANVTTMNWMFRNCSSLTSLDVSKFNTENVTDMRGMFSGCSSLTTIYADEDKWSTANVGYDDEMFTGCTSLVGGIGTAYEGNHNDKEYARIDKPGQPGYLTQQDSNHRLYAEKASINLTIPAVTIALQLLNDKTLLSGEFYLQLPAGFSIEVDEYGGLVAEIVSERSNNHSLEVRNNGKGKYHFLCYSGSNKSLKGNSGDFITLSVVADETVTEGIYAAELQNIIFSDENTNQVNFANSSFCIYAIDHLPGDANGDGKLNVMDIVEIVGKIMGDDSDVLVFASADIDGNGTVNVMDLVKAVRLIMNITSQVPATATFDPACTQTVSGSMKVDKAGGNAISLSVPDAGSHIAAQFIVTLTDGATLQDVVTDNEHQSEITRLTDGRYLVMAYSSSNATFRRGAPIMLHVSGNCEAMIGDVVFVDTEKKPVAFGTAVANTDGIAEVASCFAQPADIFTLDGTLVKRNAASTLGLAKGIYIISNRKVVVK